MNVVVWIRFLPMMQISFARNMLMHCISFFSSFPCLIFCYVSLFLFFSLSLVSFLWHLKSLFLPRTTIRRRGSSSSIPDFVRFCDKKARDDFYENFSDQAIHLECQVILSNFPNTPLADVISSQGWASLYEKPSRCPNVLI